MYIILVTRFVFFSGFWGILVTRLMRFDEKLINYSWFTIKNIKSIRNNIIAAYLKWLLNIAIIKIAIIKDCIYCIAIIKIAVYNYTPALPDLTWFLRY